MKKLIKIQMILLFIPYINTSIILTYFVFVLLSYKRAKMVDVWTNIALISFVSSIVVFAWNTLYTSVIGEVDIYQLSYAYPQMILQSIVIMFGEWGFFALCKKNYYSARESYIRVQGIVSEIKYDESQTTLSLFFEKTTPELDETCFKIVGYNMDLVREKGIDQKLSIGDYVVFFTALKYESVGDLMPIVALSIEDDELLSFEAGVSNLIHYMYYSKKRFIFSKQSRSM